MRLVSLAHLEGFYYKPRVDKEILKKFSQDLIALSGCFKGPVAKFLTQEDFENAKEEAKSLEEIFGSGNFYLEIQRHEFEKFFSNFPAGSPSHDNLVKQSEDEKKIEEGVLKISEELGIGQVATNDVHYIEEKDAFAQDVLLCVQTGKILSDPQRLRMVDAPSYSLKSTSEMQELFSDLPEALKNTERISKMCNLTLELGNFVFPNFEMPEEKSPTEFLKEKVFEGIREKTPRLTNQIKERLKYELAVIEKKKYATYFLVVSDFVNWSKEKGIVSTTRGSAAGSLVSYALGITNIDPLYFNLPFERFLNPHRPSLPDIDVDFADDRRDEVLAYVREKYGEDKVAQIGTFGTMMARAAVRDVARVLGWPYLKADRVAKMIPFGSQGFPMTISQAIKVNPELANLEKEDDDTKKLLNLSRQVEGNVRHMSVHAAGVVIAPQDLTEYTPLARESSSGKIITQYDMHSIEDAGLPKLDFLGVRNLSILGLSVQIVEKERGVLVDLEKIPLDDKKAFQILALGETVGLFQLSGSGMTRYLKELKPTNIFDIMAMISLFRPGPMNSIPEFIERKHNPKKIRFFDPRMKDYLEQSYGVIVYQDDVLLTAIQIAGYTWEEADKFRKAMGKKIPSEMAKQREKFIKGCIDNGMSGEKAEELFKLIEPFSAYGFNKAHAASYAIIAYQTAYMKANFPVEFMCAVMSAEARDAAKLSQAVSECRKLSIKILPPCVNYSKEGFTIEKDKKGERAIRFGLSAIKNVGRAAIDEIQEARGDGTFSSFSDFVKRVSLRAVNKKTLESLIKAGAMGSFGTRSELLSNTENIKRFTQVSSRVATGQESLFEPEEEELSKFPKADNFEEVNTKHDESSQNLLWEREFLGFYLTKHPLDDHLAKLTKFKLSKFSDVEDISQNGSVLMAGFLSSLRKTITKKNGQEMAFGVFEDDTGSLDIVFFPKVYSAYPDLIEKDKAILVLGKISARNGEEKALLCDHIFDISEDFNEEKLKPYVKEDFLELELPHGTTLQELKRVSHILKKNPGLTKVAVVIPAENGDSKRVELPFKIALHSNLRDELERLGCSVVFSHG